MAKNTLTKKEQAALDAFVTTMKRRTIPAILRYQFRQRALVEKSRRCFI